MNFRINDNVSRNGVIARIGDVHSNQCKVVLHDEFGRVSAVEWWPNDEMKLEKTLTREGGGLFGLRGVEPPANGDEVRRRAYAYVKELDDIRISAGFQRTILTEYGEDGEINAVYTYLNGAVIGYTGPGVSFRTIGLL